METLWIKFGKMPALLANLFLTSRQFFRSSIGHRPLTN
jgi:hypothetical protein